jgi:GNAT superfamily N-acetyltransferase
MSHEGASIREISEQEFRDFAKRYATSPEIGPIATSLDSGAKKETGVERKLVGLWGCETLCAVACFHLYQSAVDKARLVLKLDSVVVAPPLRRRGLAGLLVARGFADLVSSGVRNIVRIYAHSVHPATVLLLRRLGFHDPQAFGAPISDLNIEAGNREALLQACETEVRDQMARMRLQCEFCRKGDKRARRWCTQSGDAPKSF